MNSRLVRYGTSKHGKLAIAIVVFLMMLIILRSFIPSQPVQPVDVVIFVDHKKPPHIRSYSSSSSLVEVRKYIGNTDGASIAYTRYLYEEANPQNFLQLPGGMFHSMSGEFPLMLSDKIPEFVTGRWCSVMTLFWQPSFSQRQFHSHTPPVCFEVTEYE